MTLRKQLLALFAALAVVPLLAIGVVDYVRSIRALEQVIASQTDQVAEQMAVEIADRYATMAANLALLVGNSGVPAILGLRTAAPDSAAHEATVAYLDRLWTAVARDFARVQYFDSAGAVVATRAAEPDSTLTAAQAAARLYVIRAPIVAGDDVVIGHIEAAVRLDSLVSLATLDTRIGQSGRSALVDTVTGEVLRVSTGTGTQSPPFGMDRELLVAALRGRAGTEGKENLRRIAFTDGDSAHIATLAPVAQSPFAVLSVGNVDEFSGPFGEIRKGNLSIVILTTAIVATLFVVLLWRATRSLSLLTLASDEVGRGNFAPQLPRAGGDEVGRLSAAFATMIARVRETLAETERSRQMAAVGEFASQISHEIRTPLTSIKLNLQTLERATQDGGVRSDLQAPIRISLREIQRLDRVVRGVLKLGRGSISPGTTFPLRDAAISAVDLMRPALERQSIEVIVVERADGFVVRADRSLLQAAIMNILANAAEAMRDGGIIRVVSEDAVHEGRPVSRVRVEDIGPGIPAADREKVFTPFFSTKAEGTGLGLALAHRTVEEHHGRLWAEGREDVASGAAFVIELPAAERAP